MPIYTYTKNSYNFIQLLDEVYSAITKQLYVINEGDVVDGYADANGNQINFVLNDALSGGEQTTLLNTVNAHVANPNYTNLSMDNISYPNAKILTNTLTATTISGGTILGDGRNIKGISGTLGITVDGGGNVITAGQKGYLVIPSDVGITGWNIIANTIGNCTIDIWKASGLTIPNSSIDSITGNQYPNLVGQQINSNASPLTSWVTGATANDVLAFNVISAVTVSRVTLIVKTIKK